MADENRVHVLGMGNLSKLLAHGIKKQHNTPVTLLFHRRSLFDDWETAGRKIEIITNEKSDIQTGFDVELVSEGDRGTSPIKNLIVGTKTHSTAAALMPLKDRIGHDTTLLFLQNGMGTMDEVTTTCFPDEKTRPMYIAGIVNHGVYALSQFSSVHAAHAPVTIGPTSISANPDVRSEPDYLSKLVVDTPVLDATWTSPSGILQAQLTKLSINAAINPMTVIFACRNGELLDNPKRQTLQASLLREISPVLQELIYVASDGSPNPSVLEKFSFKSIHAVVEDIGIKVAKNISSMRQDAIAGRKTEIDYINGYLVKKADEFGIETPLNRKIVEMVRSGVIINDGQIKEYFGI